MKPPFSLDNTMLNLLVEISQKFGFLQFEYERNLQLRKQNRIRSVWSSVAIENNSLTLEQVSDVLDGKAVFAPPKDIQEAKNAYDAYDAMMSFDPYCVADLLAAHRLMMQGIAADAGAFRSGDVGIFNSGGGLVHVGARPQFVPKLVADLLTWAKNDDTPMLVKSAVVHYELEVIHPFSDGNGRMGRLWQSVMLAKFNPLFAWLPVETMVHENQDGYYRALGSADKANDSTAFVMFMLEMISQTLDKYSTAHVQMSDKVSDKMSDTQSPLFAQVHRHLLQYGQIDNAQAQVLLGKSAATVRRYLSNWTAQGLLEAVGENKQRIYRLNQQNQPLNE
ncbi:Fic family protein [Neisseria yangbaofengii]|uniref:Fic family protein n=1 Tax=Neisseria yangbaofengii TaxID=2709396 RepID=UPI0013ED4500|nr:Fic family protein [Neisseria yangbaofengii]